MRRYPRLLRIFYQNTLSNELEYRLNFWANILQSLFWLGWASASVGLYYFHAEDIAGWRYHEALIVMGLFFTINGFWQMVVTPNLSRLPEYVKLGTLDYILTKPVNSQFLVSLRHVGVLNWSEPLLGMGLVVYALSQLGHAPRLDQIVLFALLFVVGMVMLYSISLMVQTLTIWLVSVEQVDLLVQGLLETARFPVSFYRGWVSGALTVIVPIAFMTTFPAQALLGRVEVSLVAGGVIFAALLFAVASWFWHFALRYYTGASS